MIFPDRRQFLFGGIMLASAGASALLRPGAAPDRGQSRALDHAVPYRLGPYRAVSAAGVVLPPRDELSERLYDSYLARGFVAQERPPVMLVIAYGSTQDYALQVHRPESCYPASGYAIGQSVRAPLSLGGRAVDATVLTATRGSRMERVLYWTRIGTAFPPTLWEERYAIARDILARRMPDGVLVRLSTPVVDGNQDAATRLLADFNDALIDAVAPAGRRLLLGPATA